jgi:hypothetical protein
VWCLRQGILAQCRVALRYPPGFPFPIINCATVYIRNACPLCCDRENGFVDYQRFVGCVVPSSGCPSPVSRCSQVPTGVSVSDLRWSIILALSGDFVRGSLSSVALLTCTNWRFCDGHAKFCSNHMNRILMPIQKVILVHGCS